MADMIQALIGIFVASAFLVLFLWWGFRSFEKGEKSPKRRRRNIIAVGILYSAIAAYNILRIIVGAEPVKTLIGLPIGLLLIWAYFRGASEVKIPPEQP
jgi:hypothetical protein